MCVPPPPTQELREDCIAFRILTLSSFFSPSPSLVLLPLSLLLLPPGLSHLMMSEQGRCLLPVVLQLPELLAFVPLAGCSETHRCWQAVCCLSLLSWARLAAGPPFLTHRGFPPPPSPWLLHSAPPFVIRALALPGCLREGSMKRGMTA